MKKCGGVDLLGDSSREDHLAGGLHITSIGDVGQLGVVNSCIAGDTRVEVGLSPTWLNRKGSFQEDLPAAVR